MVAIFVRRSLNAPRTCILRCWPAFLRRPPLYELQPVGASGKTEPKTKPKKQTHHPMNPTTPPACTPAPEAAAGELPLGECAALIGLDWGDKAHAVALRARGSGRVETLDLEHSAESLHGW